MKTTKIVILVGCVAAAGIALGSCREDEQDRVLQYNKGRYSGKSDTPISSAARRAIHDRVRQQSGLDAAGGGGGEAGGASSSADVRPPANAVRQ